MDPLPFATIQDIIKRTWWYGLQALPGQQSNHRHNTTECSHWNESVIFVLFSHMPSYFFLSYSARLFSHLYSQPSISSSFFVFLSLHVYASLASSHCAGSGCTSIKSQTQHHWVLSLDWHSNFFSLFVCPHMPILVCAWFGYLSYLSIRLCLLLCLSFLFYWAIVFRLLLASTPLIFPVLLSILFICSRLPSLPRLYLDNNQITDTTPLNALTGLTQYCFHRLYRFICHTCPF